MIDWTTLSTKAAAVADRPILDLFDDTRADDFSVSVGDLTLDYAKTNMDAETRALLV